MSLPARCTLAGSPEITFTTSVVDISPGGICFLANERIEPGTMAAFEIKLDGNLKIAMKAKITWCDTPQSDKPCRAGVQIVDIEKGDLEKFIQFYCQKLFAYLKSRKKILIVDDEKDMVELLTYELEKKEYDVISAHDGQAGFTKYLEEWPDLVILDVTLPKLNGIEVCRKIRREKNDTRTPIIMLTARDKDEDKIVGSVVGAERYITKPFDAAHLMSEIDKFLKVS